MRAKDWASEITGFALILGLGCILTAMVNKAAWVGFKFSHIEILAPMTAFYALGRFWLCRPAKDDSAATASFKKLYRIVLGIVALALLALLPFLWWGVIRELAAQAGRG